MPFEIELPGAYIDSLAEDTVPATAGQTPVLINLDPAPNEAHVHKATNIGIDIATVDVAGSIDLAYTKVYVDGVLVFDGGVFDPSFGGAESSFSLPQSDVLRLVLDRASDFASLAVVTVRVVTRALGDSSVFDQTYSFTIADTTAPRLAAAEAVDLMRVLVTFNESVASSALLPENWALDRFGDYLTPLVSASVIAVEAGVDAAHAYLITDIPLTPGGTYRATVANVLDLYGNAIDEAENAVFFAGWTPPAPAGRALNLYGKLPELNQREDTTKDLLRWCGCLQEITTLLLYDIDRFLDILDPDTAPEDFVDAMLADLGNPFDFSLSLVDKRRLLSLLVQMYQLKGTGVGITDVARFFLAIEIVIDAFNGSGTWALGESELGYDTALGTSVPALLYSFEVIAPRALSTTEAAQLTAIVDYMKPAHTHFARLRQPETPIEDDVSHLELGLSLLGENWTLH